MNAVTILVITGIVALLLVGLIIAAVLISENKLQNNKGTTGTTGTTGPPDFVQKVPPPIYTRISPKSNVTKPLSISNPSFTDIQHPVPKLSRMRSIKTPVSPNHWIGNSMYSTYNDTFLLYPYLARINNDSFEFSWPSPGIIDAKCQTTSCPTGYADLNYVTASNHIVTISCAEEILSCDIVDVDALVTNVVWQYGSGTTVDGSISMPLAKGCPYVTAFINNLSVSLKFDFDYTYTVSGSLFQNIMINANSGYLLIVPNTASIKINAFKIVEISKMTGAIRLAYYDSKAMLDYLEKYFNIYPTESTISIDASSFQIKWTTALFDSKVSTLGLAMVSLPQHNISNNIYSGNAVDHSIIGPFNLTLTLNNNWELSYPIDILPTYPPVRPNYTQIIIDTWNKEIINITKLTPQKTVDWIKWVASIGQMILIGNMLKQDTSVYQTLLEKNLGSIKLNNGQISLYNTLVYDTIWNGVIGNLGLTNSAGTSDNGNAYYEAHNNQYGYLLYAFAIAGKKNSLFLKDNLETMLYFVRDIANTYELDPYFPLWRNKDWYFGYSLMSGLVPDQPYCKMTYNIGESAAGYYGIYLLGQLLNNDEFVNYSTVMLAYEISG